MNWEATNLSSICVANAEYGITFDIEVGGHYRLLASVTSVTVCLSFYLMSQA